MPARRAGSALSAQPGDVAVPGPRERPRREPTTATVGAVNPAPDTSPGGGARRPPQLRLLAATAALVVVAAAALGTRAWRASPGCDDGAGGRAPIAVARAVLPVVDEVAASPHVASVVATCLTYPGPVRPDGTAADVWAAHLDVRGVDVDAVPGAVQALADAASPSAPVVWSLEVATADRDVAVTVRPGGDAQVARAAVEVRRAPGVRRVVASGAGGDASTLVTVASTEDVVGAVAAAAEAGTPTTTVDVADAWLEVAQVRTGDAPAQDVVRVAVDAVAWPGVYRVVLRGGGAARADLAVHVDDDTVREDVADRLDAVAADVAGAASYRVESPTVQTVGVLGPDAVAAAADATRPAAGEDVRACTGDELELALTGFDVALGSRFLRVTATSAASTPCRLQGMPDLAAMRTSGTLVPSLTLEPARSRPAEPAAVVLQPGQAATSELRWGAMSTSQDPDTTVALLVTAVPDGPQVTLPVAQAVPDDPPGTASVDILHGATVRVGDWAPSPSP